MTYNDLAVAVIGMALAFGLGVGAGVLLMRDRLRESMKSDNEKIKAYREQNDVLRASVSGWQRWYDRHMEKCRLMQIVSEYEMKRDRAARDYEQKSAGGRHVT